MAPAQEPQELVDGEKDGLAEEEAWPAEIENDLSESPQSRLRRHQHSGLWPVWSVDRYEDGSVRRFGLFGTIRSETDANGDGYHTVLPFYGASSDFGGAETRLGIYPLLYFRHRHPRGGHDLALPFFATWFEDADRDTIVWPLLHIASREVDEPYLLFPTLFGHERWAWGHASRFGVPYLFDLFEAIADEDETAWQLGAFFPWGAPARAGLPLARFRSSGEEDTHDWHQHVFPLWALGASDARDAGYFYSLPFATWHERAAKNDGEIESNASANGEDASADRVEGWAFPMLLSGWESRPDGHDVHVLAPLGRHRASAERRTLSVWPFFHDDEALERWRLRAYALLWWDFERYPSEERSRWFPPLLAHSFHSPEGYAYDLLWPLIHHSEQGLHDEAPESRGDDTGAAATTITTRVLPFWDRFESPEKSAFGVGGLLWRHLEYRDGSFERDWFLAPLGRRERTPDSELDWLLPFDIRSRSEDEFQRSGFTAFIPFWWSGHESLLYPGRLSELDDASDFDAGFDLDDASDSEREEAALKETVWWHSWPFIGRSRTTSAHSTSVTWRVLAPLVRLRREWSRADDEHVSTELDLPWPLINYSSERASWDFRLLPSLFLGRDPSRGYGYIYPLLSVENGPGAESGFAARSSLVQWNDDEERQVFRIFPLIFEWIERKDARIVTGPLGSFRLRDEGAEGWFHLVPLGFGSWSEGREQIGVFPFYYRERFGREPLKRWPIGRLFFLYSALRSEHESHDSFLWKLVESTRATERSARPDDYEFRILHRLFLSRDTDGQKELVLNPLFRWLHDERTGESEFSILRFVYSRSVGGGVATTRLFHVPIWESEVGR